MNRRRRRDHAQLSIHELVAPIHGLREALVVLVGKRYRRFRYAHAASGALDQCRSRVLTLGPSQSAVNGEIRIVSPNILPPGISLGDLPYIRERSSLLQSYRPINAATSDRPSATTAGGTAVPTGRGGGGG